jgi:hypothetical protein
MYVIRQLVECLDKFILVLDTSVLANKRNIRRYIFDANTNARSLDSLGLVD